MRQIAVILGFLWGISAFGQTIDSHTLAQCKTANTAITTGTVCGGSSVPGAAINTTSSSLLVLASMNFVSVGVGGTCTATPSDDAPTPNSWNALTVYKSGTWWVKMWYAIPSSSANLSATHHFSLSSCGTSNFNTIAVVALHGAQAATAYRAGSDTGAAIVGTNISVTATAAADAIITFMSDDSATAKTISVGTILDSTIVTANGETGASGYIFPGSTSTQNFQWGPGGSMAAAAFEVGPAPAASGTLTPSHGSVF